MNLSTLSKQIYEGGCSGVNWKQGPNASRFVMPIISDLTKAHFAYYGIDRKFANIEAYDAAVENGRIAAYDQFIKDTFQDHLADATIKIHDMAGYLNTQWPDYALTVDNIKIDFTDDDTGSILMYGVSLLCRINGLWWFHNGRLSNINVGKFFVELSKALNTLIQLSETEDVDLYPHVREKIKYLEALKQQNEAIPNGF